MNSSDIAEKIDLFNQFYNKAMSENFFKKQILETDHLLDLPVEPPYASFCLVVKQTDVPARKNLHSIEGKAELLHALCHIEYSAIDLALDHIYRFRQLPPEYVLDWLKVAEEEVEHFKMLRGLLIKTGIDYGDLPVHASLFHAMQKTAGSVIDRMAVIPRYLEASGLDATVRVRNKLKELKDSWSQKMLSAMDVIENDEIDHVKKGDRWFRYSLNQTYPEKNPVDVFFEIINRNYKKRRLASTGINYSARKKAGFSEEELNRMTQGTK